MININNLCQFEGRISKDLDVKTVGQGKNAFTKVLFNIAVDRQLSKDQRDAARNGDTSIVTADFIPCVANGAKADVIKDYFMKGKPIKVFCSYQTWVTDDGNGGKKYGHIFVVEEFGFVIKDTTDSNGNGGGNNNGGNRGNNRSNNNRGNNYNNNRGNNSRNTSNNEDDFYSVGDDDIPF